MNLRTTLVCAAGVCLGVTLYQVAAGGSGRLIAAPRPAPAVPDAVASANALLAPAGPSAEALGLDAATFQAQAAETKLRREAQAVQTAGNPVGHSRIFQSLVGPPDVSLGEFVARVVVDRPFGELPTPGPTGIVVLDPSAADGDALAAALAAVREAKPSARVALLGFAPDDQASQAARDRDAARLASVDLLALVSPRGPDADAVKSVFDRVGRHGRRVLALVEIPRGSADLPGWKNAFRGSVAAGVGIVLTGEPGGDPATEAAWRKDVADHQALQRRLGGVAYD